MENNQIKKVDDFEKALIERDQALRYNEGKLSWSMVDFDSLEGLVRVLEYGARKYSLNLNLSCVSLLQLCNKTEFVINATILKGLLPEDFVKAATHPSFTQKQSAVDAIKLEQFVQKVCALPAMKQIGSKHLLKKQNQDESMQQNTDLGLILKSGSEKDQSKDPKSQDIQKLKNVLSSCVDLQNTESLKVFTKSELNLGVKFAEVLSDYTLITAIQLEDTEVFFVANATTQLDCFKIILNLFKKLQIISEKVQIDKSGFSLAGKDNWKKGMPVTQVTESLMRHLFAFLRGEDVDPESGCRHISHVMCNTMFLEYILREKPHYDDRKVQNNIQ